MPRTPNTVRTVTITISTTPPVYAHLERLVASGLFGKNPAEAAERLIARGIENHLGAGALLRDGGHDERGGRA